LVVASHVPVLAIAGGSRSLIRKAGAPAAAAFEADPT
jgi:hypothetical protein